MKSIAQGGREGKVADNSEFGVRKGEAGEAKTVGESSRFRLLSLLVYTLPKEVEPSATEGNSGQGERHPGPGISGGGWPPCW